MHRRWVSTHVIWRQWWSSCNVALPLYATLVKLMAFLLQLRNQHRPFELHCFQWKHIVRHRCFIMLRGRALQTVADEWLRCLEYINFTKVSEINSSEFKTCCMLFTHILQPVKWAFKAISNTLEILLYWVQVNKTTSASFVSSKSAQTFHKSWITSGLKIQL